MIFEMNTKKAAYLDWPKMSRSIKAERSFDKQIIQIPVLSDNTLVAGKIGCGKTTYVKKQVEERLDADPNLYAVFFEIKPNDYSGKFMRPEDKKISFRDITGSQNNLFKWNLIKEIKQSLDPDAEIKKMSAILFEHLEEDTTKIIWAQGAKETFEGFLSTVVYCMNKNPSNYELINVMKNMKTIDFLKFLSKYKPNKGLLNKYFHYDANQFDTNKDSSNDTENTYKIPRMGSDILVFVQNVLSKFSGSFLSKDGNDTIGEWLNGKYGNRLFITYDYEKKDSMALFTVYFLKNIILERLSQRVDRSKSILMVLDEITELEHDFGLMQGVTLGRENKLQIIVSTQSIEKLYLLAPNLSGSKSEHYTNAMLAGFPVLISFQLGDPNTIKTFQTFYGNKEKYKMVMPISRYSTIETKIETEPIVRDEDFASLKRGECYIKIGDAEPERVRLLL